MNRAQDLTTDAEELRIAFERLARDSMGFKRSRKGNYVNPQVARDWKWFQLGYTHAEVQGLKVPQSVLTVLHVAVEQLHVSSYRTTGLKPHEIDAAKAWITGAAP